LKTRQPRQGSRVTILPTVKIVKGTPLRHGRDVRSWRKAAFSLAIAGFSKISSMSVWRDLPISSRHGDRCGTRINIYGKGLEPRQGSRVTILPTVKIVKNSPLRHSRHA
jgi:hypothetical protein